MNNLERPLLPKERKILEAAAEMIGEDHYAIHTVKVADIANRAEVGKGTVYEYFSSKEEIIQKAVCLCVLRQMEGAWSDALSKGSFREIIYYAMERMLKEVGSPSVWNFPLILELLNEESTKAVMAEMRTYCFERMMPSWQEILDRGAAEGLFPPQDVKSVLQAFIQLFSGLAFIANVGLSEDLRLPMDRGYVMLLKALQ